MDNPINSREPAVQISRAEPSGPAGQRRQGAMGDRRVSETPPEARRQSLRLSEKADAPESRRSLRSKEAVAGAPIAASAPIRVHPGVMEGADHPSRPAQQASDFVTTNRRLRSLHANLPFSEVKCNFRLATQRLSRWVLDQFNTFVDDLDDLPRYDGVSTKAEQAYTSLQDKARRAENDGDSARASAIRDTLAEIDRQGAETLQTLTEALTPARPSTAREPQQAPAATVPTTVDWCTIYRQLVGIRRYFEDADQHDDAQQFLAVIRRLENQVRRRFQLHHGNRDSLRPPQFGRPSRSEQMCRFLEDLAHRTEPASCARRPSKIHRTMHTMIENARKELNSLTRKYGSLETLAALAARAGLIEQQAPVTVGSTPMPATAQATVAPPLQPVDPVPAPGSVPAPPPPARPRPETCAAEAPTLTELFSQPPGPSSRGMPAQAPRTPTAPVPEVPFARREAIVERFGVDEALLDAGFALGNSGAYALGWTAMRSYRVLDDLHRLHTSAAEDPRAAAALADIDWRGIEALTEIMDLPSPSP